MEKYIPNDELERLLMENIFEFYEEEMGEDTKMIYKDFLCDTKEKLRNTLNDEQKKFWNFWSIIWKYTERLLSGMRSFSDIDVVLREFLKTTVFKIMP